MAELKTTAHLQHPPSSHLWQPAPTVHKQPRNTNTAETTSNWWFCAAVTFPQLLAVRQQSEKHLRVTSRLFWRLTTSIHCSWFTLASTQINSPRVSSVHVQAQNKTSRQTARTGPTRNTRRAVEFSAGKRFTVLGTCRITAAPSPGRQGDRLTSPTERAPLPGRRRSRRRGGWGGANGV